MAKKKKHHLFSVFFLFPFLSHREVSMSPIPYQASPSVVVRRAGGGVRRVSAPSAVSGSSDCATLGRDIVLSSG